MFTVGFASAEFKITSDRIIGWYPMEDFKNEADARRLVNKLNGGPWGINND